MLLSHDDTYFMERARQEALKALDDGEVPVGAIITNAQGQIIGRGCNAMERLADATAHAEIIAIGAAARSLGDWRLNGCTLYATVEPCIMCTGALLNARIQRIVYGCSDNRLGGIDSHPYRPVLEGAYKKMPEIPGGILAQECKSLMQTFFQQLRKKS
jgi:tRNA(adenine34) deaminase